MLMLAPIPTPAPLVPLWWWAMLVVAALASIAWAVFVTWWMLRVLRHAEATSRAAQETREFVRAIGGDARAVKGKLFE